MSQMAGSRAATYGPIVTDQPLPNLGPAAVPAPEAAGPAPKSPAPRSLLHAALRRARWTIFWERLWPALASLATVLGLFLALSWLGLWIFLPPLGRAAVMLVLAGI